MSTDKTLSIVIPVYNEEKTLEELIMKVINLELMGGILKEIVMVNDGSKDKSWQIMLKLAAENKGVKAFENPQNLGKSQTVRNGIMKTTGDYVVIQDADLEYEPTEINDLLKKMVMEDLDVVYGNRFGKDNKVIYWQNYIGNKALSAFSNLFTYPKLKTWIPDMEVCYKLINGDIAREVGATIESKSTFGLEPEITAKLAKYKKDGKSLKFGIVPISYYPRSIAEGKKMHAIKDGMKALREIIKFNLAGS
jgi:glycosyltransferase involved in cell wall biosynthesis